MNVVDSSAWLEYLAGGPNAAAFAERSRMSPRSWYQRLPCTKSSAGCPLNAARGALLAVALMSQGTIVDLDADLAIAAADPGLERGLPMADSIILASAQRHGATLWTQDGDFEGMAGVEYRQAGGAGGP